ncbi:MAG: hypothetical protein D6731_20145 [Planctomycetota bacterium]|nr:MAG: hypothetical protein D6731_20145 [Planctomycetota bacterium]
MPVPRRLVPGQSHFVTRRTRNRRALLLPSPEVLAVVLYCAGRAQSLCPGLSLHALTLETTHLHAGVTDAEGHSLLPVFFQCFHGLVARALNAHYGLGENFWRTGSYDNTETHTREDFVEQLLYAWTQPVKDGLVDRPEDWPGVLFLPEDFGTTRRIPKPPGAFFGGRRPEGHEPTDPRARREHRARERQRRERKRAEDAARDRARGRNRRRRRQLARERESRRKHSERAARPPRDRSALPEEVVLRIGRPPGFEGWPIEEVRRYFRRLLDARVQRLLRERKASGKSAMGLERALAGDPRRSLGEPLPRFARNPRIACKNRELRKLLLRRLQAWRNAYRDALERWRNLDRTVRFPYGSYLLPTLHGAKLAAPRPPPALA